jgi:hypothetical protein
MLLSPFKVMTEMHTRLIPFCFNSETGLLYATMIAHQQVGKREQINF